MTDLNSKCSDVRNYQLLPTFFRCPKIDKADPKIIGCLTSNLDSATGSLMAFYPDLASSSASSAKLPEAVARDMKDYDEVSSLDGGAPPDMEAAVARRQTDQVWSPTQFYSVDFSKSRINV